MTSGGTDLGETIRWAAESMPDAAMAAADWIARDIDPQYRTAVELVTSPLVALERLREAKAAYKTMRVVGETSDDRRLAAQLYAATIASALVHHHRSISRQSHEAIGRALVRLHDDRTMCQPLRTLAGAALSVLQTR